MIQRFSAPDVLRGLVMVIMALDHTRDFLHVSALSQDPTDLSTTTPALFFTRWITHFCAPIFVFLSGLSAYFSLQSGPMAGGRSFLLKRGAVLMLLELTLVNFLLWFDPGFHTITFQVIFAIGFGLSALWLASRLPARVVGAMGLTLLIVHQLVPAVTPEEAGPAGFFLHTLLWKFGVFPAGAGRMVLILYPLLPWMGILCCGYAAAPWLLSKDGKRNPLIWYAALTGLLAFVILRTWNLYGDPRPWAPQADPVFSVLSYLNVSKYPPSLLFAAMTLGPMFLALYFLEGKNNAVLRFLKVYGQVPMFFYLVHWLVIHLVMYGMLYSDGIRPSAGALDFGRPAQQWGLSLAGVYGVWAAIVLLLYPLCYVFGRYKHANKMRYAWLRYI